MTYVDYIAIRPELVIDGEPQGIPDPLPGVAATVGGTRTVDGETEYLCRVRVLSSSAPSGLMTEEDFKAEHPDDWASFGMDPVTVETDDGTEVYEPQIPVFL